MLARPFRNMSRPGLIVLLIVSLLLEAALGAGLYRNNRPAAAAPVATAPPVPTPYPTPDPRTVLQIQNDPRTVAIGHYETFSVTLKNYIHVPLLYTLSYPDGTTEEYKVKTDSHGYSKHRFLISFKPKGQRDTIGISVSYQGKQQVYTRFAVSQATAGKK